MSEGSKLPVSAFDRDFLNELASGTLEAIDNQVDPGSGTIRLKAIFPNDGGFLFPNQFVNARLLVDTLRNVVIVSAAAIQRGPDFNFVYAVTPESVVKLRKVEVGPTEGEQTVVTSGLSAGEIVVTDGIDKLQDGTKVTQRSEGGRSGK